MTDTFVRYLGTNLYTHQRRGALGPEMEMQCQDCGRSVVFLNPEPHRVRFYAGSHRCGDGNHTWQETAG